MLALVLGQARGNRDLTVAPAKQCRGFKFPDSVAQLGVDAERPPKEGNRVVRVRKAPLLALEAAAELRELDFLAAERGSVEHAPGRPIHEPLDPAHGASLGLLDGISKATGLHEPEATREGCCHQLGIRAVQWVVPCMEGRTTAANPRSMATFIRGAPR